MTGGVKARILRYLQGWIGVVGLIAIGNTVSCFRSFVHLHEKIYTHAPDDVNALTGRLFGLWTCVSGCLRLYCAFDIKNRALYNLTLLSFILAFLHFITEVALYKTASLDSFGVASPLIISGMTTIWMIGGYFCMGDKNSTLKDEGDSKSALEEMRMKRLKKSR